MSILDVERKCVVKVERTNNGQWNSKTHFGYLESAADEPALSFFTGKWIIIILFYFIA
jgi:hypothetical protein